MCRGEETGKVSDLLEINISNIYWHLRHLICCVSSRNKLPGPLNFSPILHHVPVTIWRQRDCISLRENEKSLIKWWAERYHWTFQSFHSLNKAIKNSQGRELDDILYDLFLFCFLPLFPVAVSGYFSNFFLFVYCIVQLLLGFLKIEHYDCCERYHWRAASYSIPYHQKKKKKSSICKTEHKVWCLTQLF